MHHIYCAWFTMAGNTSVVNLSNSTNVKLVNILSNLGIAHIIMSTSWTRTLGSTHRPAPLFNSLALNIWNELVTKYTNKVGKSTLPLPIHVHKQSFQHFIIISGKEAKTTSHRTKTMTWKWGHDLQMEIPFTSEMKRNSMWEAVPLI